MEPNIVELKTEEDVYRFFLGHFQQKLVARGVKADAAKVARDSVDGCAQLLRAYAGMTPIEVMQAITAAWMDTATLLAFCQASTPDA